MEKRTDDGYDPFHWSHHPQPDWEENEYTKWLTEKGQDWFDLQGEKISPYVHNGPPAEYSQTAWCAEKTIDFIKNEKGKPWFFSFNCFDPHHPFDPPKEYLRNLILMICLYQVCTPRRPMQKPLFKNLIEYGPIIIPGEFQVESMTDRTTRDWFMLLTWRWFPLIDDQVGRILQALEETGQADDTLVVFMSDHGEMLGDHGIYFKGPHFYDCQMRVPLIMRWPNGGIVENRQVDGFVELVDLMPTFLEAAGLVIPSAVQGRSLLPSLLVGKRMNFVGEQVYAEYYNAWTHSEAYGTMLRTKKLEDCGIPWNQSGGTL